MLLAALAKEHIGKPGKVPFLGLLSYFTLLISRHDRPEYNRVGFLDNMVQENLVLSGDTDGCSNIDSCVEPFVPLFVAQSILAE